MNHFSYVPKSQRVDKLDHAPMQNRVTVNLISVCYCAAIVGDQSYPCIQRIRLIATYQTVIYPKRLPFCPPQLEIAGFIKFRSLGQLTARFNTYPTEKKFKRYVAHLWT